MPHEARHITRQEIFDKALVSSRQKACSASVLAIAIPFYNLKCPLTMVRTELGGDDAIGEEILVVGMGFNQS
jgi:hypothetical protein